MACCILGAIILSHVIAIWRHRRRWMIGLAGLAISTSAFAWQLDAHWHHIQQFGRDMQALVRGHDPAEAALAQAGLLCNGEPARK